MIPLRTDKDSPGASARPDANTNVQLSDVPILPAALTNALAAAKTAASGVAKKAARLATVEQLRVLAMLEIVRYHDHGDRLAIVGGLGLPTFLLLTNVFNTTLTGKRGSGQFLKDKWNRLAVPWLFWSVFYGAWLLQGAIRKHIALSDTFDWSMILGGTSSHLWFVPFALASAGAIAGTQHLTRNLPDKPTAYVGLAVGGAVLIGFSHLPDHEWPVPMGQWILSAPSTFLGFGLGRLMIAHQNQLRFGAVRLVLLAALGIAGVCLLEPNFLMNRYAVSTVLVIGAILIPGKSDAVSTFIAPLLFGVYLVHHVIADRFLSHVPGVAGTPYLFLVDFAITVGVVWLMKKTPLKRFV